MLLLEIRYDIISGSISYFALLSSICGGFVRLALSPILIPRSLPDSDCTSLVGSSLARRSINDLSACNTRLEFYRGKTFKGYAKINHQYG